ncbi:MAG: choice-of-anchor D domain-containing protein [Wenzhouxiangella sp.]
MYLKTFAKTAVCAAMIGFGGSAIAQDTAVITIDSVSGTPGSTVEVTYSITLNNLARSYNFDVITSDLSLLEGGSDGIDVSRCLENSDTGDFISNCVVRNPPNNASVRLGQTNIADPIPDLVPIGTVLYTISSDAAIGSEIELNVQNIAIENITDFDITNGTITVIDTDAVLTLTPDSVDFGTQDINDPAQTADFTIGNAGDNDSLTINAVEISSLMPVGISNGAFSVTNNCDGIEVAPGGSCVVTVTFDPDVAGTFEAELVVNSTAGTESADLSGAATATANVVINPPFGPVNLGFGAAGDVLTANGTVSNTGSAAASVSCDLTGDVDVFSTDPSPLAATLDPGASVGFSLSCALPTDAEEGDAFSATLACDIDGEPAGTHELSCSVSTFEPLPVPTMQAWALGLFALLMLLVGGISIRFFRAA